MIASKARWLTAYGAAILLAATTAGRSQADFAILVTESDSATPLFNSTITGVNGSIDTSSAFYSNIHVSPGTSFFGNTANLTTGVRISVANGASGSSLPSLTITVTDMGTGSTGIVNSDGTTGNLTNAVAFTTTGLSVTPSAISSILDSASSSVLGTTPPASLTIPANSGNGTQSFGTASGIGGTYNIVQKVDFSVSGNGTLGGTVSSDLALDAAAVPAPPSFVLAALAIPAIGLRRVLRRKTAA